MKKILMAFIILFTFGFGMLVVAEDSISEDVTATNKVGYATFTFVDNFTELWTAENAENFNENLDQLIIETDKQIKKINDAYLFEQNPVIEEQAQLLTEANVLLKEIQSNPDDATLAYDNRIAIEHLIASSSFYSQDPVKSNEGCK